MPTVFNSLPRLGVLICLGFLAAPFASHAQECETIRFARGASSATVEGIAPADGVICYEIGTGAGQTARIAVERGRNTAFTVEGIADARADLSFQTRKGVYRILVFQLMRAIEGESFALNIAIE
jgi:hypothetical protein